MYFIIRYPPRIALNTNPMNPIADTSQTFGPLSARIAMDEPISNADTINEMDNWFFKSSKPVWFIFNSNSPFSTLSRVLLSLSGKSFNKFHVHVKVMIADC